MSDPTAIKIALFLAALLGIFVGALITGLLGALRQPVQTIESLDDSDLLDFLDETQCHLFFNKKVDEGAWGLLDTGNDLVGIGYTVRQAIQNARLRAADRSAYPGGMISEAS